MTLFWVGLVLSGILANPIFRLLLRMNSRQKVSEFAPETHQAKQGTPTMGGLIFVIPFLLIAPFIHSPTRDFWFFTRPSPSPFPWAELTFLFGLFAAIGFVDDFVVPRLIPGKRGLGWKQKLGMQFVVTVAYGLFHADRGWQLAVDVVAILACANAYNFADGLDGLAASIGLLLIPGLIGLSAAVGNYWIIPFLALAAGAMLPFAFLNAPKAKLFMGDVGSLPFGALIGAAIAIPVDPFPAWNLMIGANVLVLVLVAELLPVPIQIFWVKVFKKRLFPFTPIHHAFEKAGWPETRVVAMFALAQLVCTLGALSIFGFDPTARANASSNTVEVSR